MYPILFQGVEWRLRQPQEEEALLGQLPVPRLQLQVPLRPGAHRPHATGAQFNCFYDLDDYNSIEISQ